MSPRPDAELALTSPGRFTSTDTRGRSVCRESGFLQPPLECSEAAPCLPQGAYQKKKITSGDCSKPHNSFGWFGSGTPKVVPQVKFYL